MPLRLADLQAALAAPHLDHLAVAELAGDTPVQRLDPRPVLLRDRVVRRESELQSRSVADQLAYWVRTGRASENSGNSDHARITAVLAGDLEPMKLTDEERDVWFDSFAERMARPGPEEEAFFARRRQLGLGSGLDAGGNLVGAEANREA